MTRRNCKQIMNFLKQSQVTTQYHLISPRSPLFLRKYIVEKFGLILFRMPKIQVFASVLDLSKQALFYFPKSSYLGRNPSLHPGEGASLSRPLGQEDCRSPLSHSPPKIHLPTGKKISVLTECTPLVPAMQTSTPKWKSSFFPAGDFLEQPNQKEERNVDQIQKQRTREIL